MNEFKQIKRLRNSDVKLPDISRELIASKAKKISRLESSVLAGESKSKSLKVIKNRYETSKDK